ncbi:trifunctional serine/threonine-protein kinase/ATP-binding protein/sensor histidine kinase [Laspinema olomoucense]|uniref:trifunctional serine/threonine-protein kinase/ATP-binding protein/sensor histidine kinase n=1 Tax=Laspinema olomoucense TaxID=3231600 RepID=UPI0021BB2FA1|nr:ATP-binding sensor histidine kinase [Laspinema sp. D3a]MCT7991222.1 trifunctional serine/threonine-protein kinase/ATP-binding protein/sensor histidine kinase [Laspinema sp. D3a]
MHAIADYLITEKIHESVHTLVYRGYRPGDDASVMIKIPNAEYPTVAELVRLRNQYAIAKNLNVPGIVKALSLERDRNGLALILEDFGGISLKDYITSNPLSIADFLYIGIQIADALEALYQNRIIHKDIKPDNILIHPLTKQVKVTDFSISSRLPKESLTLVNPNALEGTLAYISPEQTGRMNRFIDYRTDFYSLGVTFYELLTGTLPFVSTDAMELVHYHIAKQPVPPNRVVSDLPQAIADMVMKLMAKNAEERYQTARGLKADLETCLMQLQTTGTIQPFAIAQKDIAARFQIPEKLYGREEEIHRLMGAFEAVAAGGAQLMLVAGYSGIGKSALVQEVHKPILAKRGYFISGKFDQFKRNIPFAPLIQAFQDLIRYHILTESPKAIATWKKQLTAALEKQGQVIIDVIPELELLLGKQPALPELPAAESQNRFNRIFPNFIRVFADEQHPLVLFLDDLQWADIASLKLLELLLSDADLHHVLVIGAYRDNEVSPVHPLMLMVNRLQQTQGVGFNRIEVPPLKRQDLNHLVADALTCPETRSQPVSELVFQKTEGNPFFVTQFLKSLYEDHLLEYDGDRGYWQCDLTQVRSLAISENIVDFMATQLQRLPAPTQTVLTLAACIGHQFDLATLGLVYQHSLGETSAQLWEALQSGVVIPVSELYKFFQGDSGSEGEEINAEVPSVQYKFLHDRVQQAAYSLIPDPEKQATHLKIGRLLLQNTPGEAVEEKVFDLVNQLNMGADLIENSGEKYQLAALNLQAGHKAKAATAYEPALRYLDAGLALLNPTSWGDRYDLTLQLHLAAAESAYLSTAFERMECLAQLVLEKADTLLDKIQVYEVKIQAYTAQNKQLEALATARESLALLGINLPEQPTFDHIQHGLGELFSRLKEHRVEALSELPKMSNPNIKAAMRILNSAIAPAYQAAPLLLPLLVFEEVNLSLEYGNTEESTYAYGCYGLILCGLVGDIDTGHRFGQLALKVLAQFENQKLKARTVMVVNNNVRFWKEPLQRTIAPLLLAYESGLETGDVEYAGLCAYNYCGNSYFAGKELGQLEAEMSSYSLLMEKLKQTNTLNYQKMYWQVVSHLIRGADHPDFLVGELYNEFTMLPLHEQTSDRYALCCLYLHKLILSYLFRENESAFENAGIGANYLDGLTAVYPLPLFYFYDSLAALGVYPKRSESEQEVLWNKVEENQGKMKKWAEFAPDNFLHKYELVEAEKARVRGDLAEAIAGYDRAIFHARESLYIQEEALANELAGEFHLQRGSQQIAQFYLTEAYYGYVRWSASAKVKFLEQKYPLVLARVTQRSVIRPFSIQETISSFATTSTSITQGSSALDMTTVMKAALALSEELVLDKFLNKLMRVILENAGAQTGFLILEQEGKQVIQAAGNIEDETVTTTIPSIEISCAGIPLEDFSCLPLSIINYVHRTGEVLVLNNAAVESVFTTDPYITAKKPKSILCFPIAYQGQTVAILYLENNLSTGVFTRDRLEVLKLLSSQAAISLENARLYHNLEQSIQDLKEAQLQLVQTEKMSTLGQLVAGVAHEINNPLSFVHGNLNLALEYAEDLLTHLQLYRQSYPEPVADIQNHAIAIDLEYLQEDFPQLLRSMNLGTDRIKEIVKSLKNFSRKDAGVFQKADIHAGLDSTLLILSNRLKATGSKSAVTVIKEYGKLPLVQCYPGQLNQVFMNLIANAIDALESGVSSHWSGVTNGSSEENNSALLPKEPESKTLRIRTEVKENCVAIHIADNGAGMSEEVQKQLFRTFFTTKPEGKGTGLGLSISHQIIVDRHQGQLLCTSQPGEGTEFTIEIPIHPENRTV